MSYVTVGDIADVEAGDRLGARAGGKLVVGGPRLKTPFDTARQILGREILG